MPDPPQTKCRSEPAGEESLRRSAIPSSTLNIVIHFGAGGVFEEAALAFARRLFAEFDEAIESIALVPVADDDLAVYLDGRLIHSASQSGRLPRLADVRATSEGFRPGPPAPQGQA